MSLSDDLDQLESSPIYAASPAQRRLEILDQWKAVAPKQYSAGDSGLESAYAERASALLDERQSLLKARLPQDSTGSLPSVIPSWSRIASDPQFSALDAGSKDAAFSKWSTDRATQLSSIPDLTDKDAEGFLQESLAGKALLQGADPAKLNLDDLLRPYRQAIDLAATKPVEAVGSVIQVNDIPGLHPTAALGDFASYSSQVDATGASPEDKLKAKALYRQNRQSAISAINKQLVGNRQTIAYTDQEMDVLKRLNKPDIPFSEVSEIAMTPDRVKRYREEGGSAEPLLSTDPAIRAEAEKRFLTQMSRQVLPSFDPALAARVASNPASPEAQSLVNEFRDSLKSQLWVEGSNATDSYEKVRVLSNGNAVWNPDWISHASDDDIGAAVKEAVPNPEIASDIIAQAKESRNAHASEIVSSIKQMGYETAGEQFSIFDQVPAKYRKFILDKVNSKAYQDGDLTDYQILEDWKKESGVINTFLNSARAAIPDYMSQLGTWATGSAAEALRWVAKKVDSETLLGASESMGKWVDDNVQVLNEIQQLATSAQTTGGQRLASQLGKEVPFIVGSLGVGGLVARNALRNGAATAMRGLAAGTADSASILRRIKWAGAAYEGVQAARSGADIYNNAYSTIKSNAIADGYSEATAMEMARTGAIMPAIAATAVTGTLMKVIPGGTEAAVANMAGSMTFFQLKKALGNSIAKGLIQRGGPLRAGIIGAAASAFPSIGKGILAESLEEGVDEFLQSAIALGYDRTMTLPKMLSAAYDAAVVGGIMGGATTGAAASVQGFLGAREARARDVARKKEELLKETQLQQTVSNLGANQQTRDAINDTVEKAALRKVMEEEDAMGKINLTRIPDDKSTGASDAQYVRDGFEDEAAAKKFIATVDAGLKATPKGIFNPIGVFEFMTAQTGENAWSVVAVRKTTPSPGKTPQTPAAPATAPVAATPAPASPVVSAEVKAAVQQQQDSRDSLVGVLSSAGFTNLESIPTGLVKPGKARNIAISIRESDAYAGADAATKQAVDAALDLYVSTAKNLAAFNKKAKPAAAKPAVSPAATAPVAAAGTGVTATPAAAPVAEVQATPAAPEATVLPKTEAPAGQAAPEGQAAVEEAQAPVSARPAGVSKVKADIEALRKELAVKFDASDLVNDPVKADKISALQELHDEFVDAYMLPPDVSEKANPEKLLEKTIRDRMKSFSDLADAIRSGDIAAERRIRSSMVAALTKMIDRRSGTSEIDALEELADKLAPEPTPLVQVLPLQPEAFAEKVSETKRTYLETVYAAAMTLYNRISLANGNTTNQAKNAYAAKINAFVEEIQKRKTDMALSDMSMRRLHKALVPRPGTGTATFLDDDLLSVLNPPRGVRFPTKLDPDGDMLAEARAAEKAAPASEAARTAAARNKQEATRVGLVDGDVQSLKKALRTVSDDPSQSKALRRVAGMLSSIPDLLAKVKSFSMVEDSGAVYGGYFDSATGELKINLAVLHNRGVADVAAHELVHAYVDAIMGQKWPAKSQEAQAVARIKSLFEEGRTVMQKYLRSPGYADLRLIMESQLRSTTSMTPRWLKRQRLAKAKLRGDSPASDGYLPSSSADEVDALYVALTAESSGWYAWDQQVADNAYAFGLDLEGNVLAQSSGGRTLYNANGISVEFLTHLLTDARFQTFIDNLGDNAPGSESLLVRLWDTIRGLLFSRSKSNVDLVYDDLATLLSGADDGVSPPAPPVQTAGAITVPSGYDAKPVATKVALALKDAGIRETAPVTVEAHPAELPWTGPERQQEVGEDTPTDFAPPLPQLPWTEQEIQQDAGEDVPVATASSPIQLPWTEQETVQDAGEDIPVAEFPQTDLTLQQDVAEEVPVAKQPQPSPASQQTVSEALVAVEPQTEQESEQAVSEETPVTAMTPAELDAAYMKAVKSKKLDVAQRMVYDVAKAAGIGRSQMVAIYFTSLSDKYKANVSAAIRAKIKQVRDTLWANAKQGRYNNDIRNYASLENNGTLVKTADNDYYQIEFTNDHTGGNATQLFEITHQKITQLASDLRKVGGRFPSDPVLYNEKGKIIPLSRRISLDVQRRLALSLAKFDADYFAAVESGDTVTVRRMLDKTAKASGFDVGPVWRGSKEGLALIRALKKDKAELATRDVTDWLSYRDTLTKRIKDAQRLVQKYIAENKLERIYLRQETPRAKAQGNAAYQIKSAEPITYDDQGNIIPPSQRFQPESTDIRYSRAATPGVRLQAARAVVSGEQGKVTISVPSAMLARMSRGETTPEDAAMLKNAADSVSEFHTHSFWDSEPWTSHRNDFRYSRAATGFSLASAPDYVTQMLKSGFLRTLSDNQLEDFVNARIKLRGGDKLSWLTETQEIRAAYTWVLNMRVKANLAKPGEKNRAALADDMDTLQLINGSNRFSGHTPDEIYAMKTSFDPTQTEELEALKEIGISKRSRVVYGNAIYTPGNMSLAQTGFGITEAMQKAYDILGQGASADTKLWRAAVTQDAGFQKMAQLLTPAEYAALKDFRDQVAQRYPKITGTQMDRLTGTPGYFEDLKRPLNALFVLSNAAGDPAYKNYIVKAHDAILNDLEAKLDPDHHDYLREQRSIHLTMMMSQDSLLAIEAVSRISDMVTQGLSNYLRTLSSIAHGRLRFLGAGSESTALLDEAQGVVYKIMFPRFESGQIGYGLESGTPQLISPRAKRLTFPLNTFYAIGRSPLRDMLLESHTLVGGLVDNEVVGITDFGALLIAQRAIKGSHYNERHLPLRNVWASMHKVAHVPAKVFSQSYGVGITGDEMMVQDAMGDYRILLDMRSANVQVENNAYLPFDAIITPALPQKLISKIPLLTQAVEEIGSRSYAMTQIPFAEYGRRILIKAKQGGYGFSVKEDSPDRVLETTWGPLKTLNRYGGWGKLTFPALQSLRAMTGEVMSSASNLLVNFEKALGKVPADQQEEIQRLANIVVGSQNNLWDPELHDAAMQEYKRRRAIIIREWTQAQRQAKSVGVASDTGARILKNAGKDLLKQMTEADLDRDIALEEAAKIAAVTYAQKQSDANKELTARAPEVAKRVLAMRRKIDVLSAELVKSGHLDGRLSAIIGRNSGIYLTRTYQIHDDPGYADLLMFEAPEMQTRIQQADEYFRKRRWQSYKNGFMNTMPHLSETMAEDYANSRMLYDGNMLAKQDRIDFINLHSKKGRGMAAEGTLNSTILLEKSDMPEVLRNLLGQNQSNIAAGARTIAELGRYNANWTFLSNLHSLLGDAEKARASELSALEALGAKASPEQAARREELARVVYLTKDSDVAKAHGLELFIPPHQTISHEAIGPLSGYYGPPALVKAMKTLSPDESSYLYKFIVRLSGLSMANLTVYSWRSQFRNLMSNIAWPLAAGHIPVAPFTGLGDKWVSRMPMAKAILATAKDETDGFNKIKSFYARWGIGGGGIVNDLLQDVQRVATGNSQQAVYDAITNAGLRGTAKAVSAFGQAASKIDDMAKSLYAFNDDIFKFMLFEKELGSYLEAYGATLGDDGSIVIPASSAATVIKNLSPNKRLTPVELSKIGSDKIELARNLLLAEAASAARDSVPYYDMMPEFFRKLRRTYGLVAGPFLSYKIAMPMTLFGSMKRVALDMKHEETRVKAMTRLVSSVATMTLYASFMGTAIKILFYLASATLKGFGDDEEKRTVASVDGPLWMKNPEEVALRNLLGPYYRDKEIEYLGTNKAGDPLYADLSWLNPASQLKDIFIPLLDPKAYRSSEDFFIAARKAIDRIAEPFYSPQILTSSFSDVAMDQSFDAKYRTGFEKAALGIFEAFKDSMVPGVVSDISKVWNARNTSKLPEELVSSVFGIKVKSLNVQEQLERALRAGDALDSEAASEFRYQFKRQEDPGNVADMINQVNEKRYRVFQDMTDTLSASKFWLGEEGARNILMRGEHSLGNTAKKDLDRRLLTPYRPGAPTIDVGRTMDARYGTNRVEQLMRAITESDNKDLLPL